MADNDAFVEDTLNQLSVEMQELSRSQIKVEKLRISTEAEKEK